MDIIWSSNHLESSHNVPGFGNIHMFLDRRQTQTNMILVACSLPISNVSIVKLSCFILLKTKQHLETRHDSVAPTACHLLRLICVLVPRTDEWNRSFFLFCYD